MIKGFKNFLMQGDLIVIAVGLVVALAFSTLIKAFTDSIITPLVKAAAGGGRRRKGLGWTLNGQRIDLGSFISAIVYFVIFMAVVYFVIVLPYRAYMAGVAPPSLAIRRRPRRAPTASHPIWRPTRPHARTAPGTSHPLPSERLYRLRVGSAAQTAGPRYRPATDRAGRDVQRSVHARASRQYQRKSLQAWPPSASIWLVGRRMPHIQHASKAAPSAPWRPAAGGPGTRRGPSGSRPAICSFMSDVAGFDEVPTPVMSPPEGWSARGRRGLSVQLT